MSLWTHLYGLAIPFFTRWRVWLRAARTVVCDNELTVTKPSRSENAVSLYYFIILASRSFIFLPSFSTFFPVHSLPMFHASSFSVYAVSYQSSYWNLIWAGAPSSPRRLGHQTHFGVTTGVGSPLLPNGLHILRPRHSYGSDLLIL